eukprot:gene22683-biopygen1952
MEVENKGIGLQRDQHGQSKERGHLRVGKALLRSASHRGCPVAHCFLARIWVESMVISDVRPWKLIGVSHRKWTSTQPISEADARSTKKHTKSQLESVGRGLCMGQTQRSFFVVPPGEELASLTESIGVMVLPNDLLYFIPIQETS